MKYEVLKGCVINAQRRNKGDVVEISDSEAKMLMGIGRIAPAQEKSEPIENRAVGYGEDKPKRRTRNKKAD